MEPAELEELAAVELEVMEAELMALLIPAVEAVVLKEMEQLPVVQVVQVL
jgi:hypothetical protein